MKLAIISVTTQGAQLGQYLHKMMSDECRCVVYEKAGRQSGGRAEYYESLQTLLKENWRDYEGFIFIMAVGIVVRSIANIIKHKAADPAVVVIDEMANNCISLLAGHIGGANDLTKIVSGLVGANAVVTTASDVNGLVTPDAVSKKLNLAIDSFAMLIQVNAEIVAKEKVSYYVDPALPEAREFIDRASILGLDFASLPDDGDFSDSKALVFVSENINKKITFEKVLYLRPRNIVAGIGCRRGMSGESLHHALTEALLSNSYSVKSLQAITSAWVKEDEQGLLELAKTLNVPIYFYDEKTLQASIDKNKLLESDFVKKEIGVGNVCEAAALAHSREAVIVKQKQSYGKITVALARVNFLS